MKEPKEILVHGKYTIKLFDESDYTLGAPSHVRTYEKIFTDTNDLLVTSQIGVALLAAEELKSSCLIGGLDVEHSYILSQHYFVTTNLSSVAQIRFLN